MNAWNLALVVNILLGLETLFQSTVCLKNAVCAFCIVLITSHWWLNICAHFMLKAGIWAWRTEEVKTLSRRMGSTVVQTMADERLFCGRLTYLFIYLFKITPIMAWLAKDQRHYWQYSHFNVEPKMSVLKIRSFSVNEFTYTLLIRTASCEAAVLNDFYSWCVCLVVVTLNGFWWIFCLGSADSGGIGWKSSFHHFQVSQSSFSVSLFWFSC